MLVIMRRYDNKSYKSKAIAMLKCNFIILIYQYVKYNENNMKNRGRREEEWGERKIDLCKNFPIIYVRCSFKKIGTIFKSREPTIKPKVMLIVKDIFSRNFH